MGITENGSATSRNFGMRSSVLILRSARAEEVPQVQSRRARVSKYEDGHGAGPHASRRIAAQPTRASVCARAAMLLSMRARRILAKRSQWRFGRRSHGERPTCGCKKWPPAPYHCFPIVIYNEPRNLRAYGTATDFGETNATRILAERSQRDFGESNFVVAERKS